MFQFTQDYFYDRIFYVITFDVIVLKCCLTQQICGFLLYTFEYVSSDSVCLVCRKVRSNNQPVVRGCTTLGEGVFRSNLRQICTSKPHQTRTCSFGIGDNWSNDRRLSEIIIVITCLFRVR